jgi:tetratricopeptide (TPR) repeat protein
MAYNAVGGDYFALGELSRAADYFTKAFELREHASEPERLAIAGGYYLNVTGELDKAAEVYQELAEKYPRSSWGPFWLANTYPSQGQYEKALAAERQAITLAPDSVGTYANFANITLSLQRFDETRQAIQQAHARKLDVFALHSASYALAFLHGDSTALAQERQWFAANPALDNFGLSLDSDTEGYAGRVGQARELTRRAVESAIRADSKEDAAIWWEDAALSEAAFGNASEARQAAAEGLKLDPKSQGVALEAALAFAMAGQTAGAKALARDLNQRYPLDTQVQSLWLRAIHAQVALNRGNSDEALDQLQRALPPIEYGQITFINQISCLYPTYIRGQAHLAAGQGKEAAAEFQKILDHSGIVWNCWTGALARLGVGRANALQAKNSTGAEADLARTRALAAYKDFLTLWKDADADIPIYKQAKAEYAKLQ